MVLSDTFPSHPAPGAALKTRSQHSARPFVSARLLAHSQSDQTSKWALVFLCRGELHELQFNIWFVKASVGPWLTATLSLSLFPPLLLYLYPPPSTRPLKAFAVWVKEEEEEILFQTQSSVAFQIISTEINSDEHGTKDVVLTQLWGGVSSL